MAKNIGKNKILSGKHSPGMLAMRQEFHDHPKQSEAGPLKSFSKSFSKRVI